MHVQSEVSNTSSAALVPALYYIYCVGARACTRFVGAHKGNLLYIGQLSVLPFGKRSAVLLYRSLAIRIVILKAWSIFELGACDGESVHVVIAPKAPHHIVVVRFLCPNTILA